MGFQVELSSSCWNCSLEQLSAHPRSLGGSWQLPACCFRGMKRVCFRNPTNQKSGGRRTSRSWRAAVSGTCGTQESMGGHTVQELPVGCRSGDSPGGGLTAWMARRAGCRRACCAVSVCVCLPCSRLRYKPAWCWCALACFLEEVD